MVAWPCTLAPTQDGGYLRIAVVALARRACVPGWIDSTYVSAARFARRYPPAVDFVDSRLVGRLITSWLLDYVVLVPLLPLTQLTPARVRCGTWTLAPTGSHHHAVGLRLQHRHCCRAHTTITPLITVPAVPNLPHGV